MEIEQFKKEKREFESSIATKIQELINIFEERTGYTPNGIDISMVQSREIGKEDKNLINFVHTEIEL